MLCTLTEYRDCLNQQSSVAHSEGQLERLYIYWSHMVSIFKLFFRSQYILLYGPMNPWRDDSMALSMIYTFSIHLETNYYD